MNYTSDYIEILKNVGIPQDYRDCLSTFISSTISNDVQNIQSIVLYGGIVRDLTAYTGWSDIDLLVVYKRLQNRDPILLAHLIKELGEKHGIRMDVTQMEYEEITNPLLLQNCFNSEILNVLAMRPNVSILVFGENLVAGVPIEQEKKAALFYINSTLFMFRRYMVESVYTSNTPENYHKSIGRLTRWTFSILRATLRLFDVFTHPYEYSMPHLVELFPDYDFSLARKLLAVRKDFSTVEYDLSIFRDIENFTNNFVKMSICEYNRRFTE